MSALHFHRPQKIRTHIVSCVRLQTNHRHQLGHHHQFIRNIEKMQFFYFRLLCRIEF